MHRAAILASLLALPVIATAEVYQCTGPDGRAVFSDRPCGADAAQMDIRENYDEPSAAAQTQRERTQEWLQRREEKEQQHRAARQREIRAQNQRRSVPGVAECPSEEGIERAIRHNEVVQCMTRQEVQDAEPMARTRKSRYNTLLESGISVEVWHYTWRDSEWPQTIYFRGDYVAGTEEFL